MKKHLIKVYCNQEIPCNPCTGICKKKAIVKETLVSLPRYDEKLCTGCLLCVAGCPGQALFYLDQERGELTFPYEFSDRPAVEESVELVDEYGSLLGIGEVSAYLEKKIYNKTTLVTVRGNLDELHKTRGIRRRRENGR